jgi:hypothetical protein
VIYYIRMYRVNLMNSKHSTTFHQRVKEVQCRVYNSVDS